jgi:hypothetical protein
MQSIQTHLLHHLVTTMIIVIYVIPYHFHNYNHGWIITILGHHAIMVVKFCNIKSNKCHGKSIQ